MRGTLIQRKPAIVPDGTGKFAISQVDGKFTLTFESVPALLFVSGEGVGALDRFFINGEERFSSRLTIESNVDKLTEYVCAKQAAVIDDEA